MIFLDMENTRRTVNERLMKGEWWFLLLTEGHNSQFLKAIQTIYDKVDKADHFELMMMSGFMPPLLAVVMIKREHVTAEQLAGVMTMFELPGMPTSRDTLEKGLEHQEIISIDANPDVHQNFVTWLGGKDVKS